MKNWIAVLIFLLMFSCALAEGPQAPALRNPQDAYEFYYEQTDGSEQMLFAMLDAMNDEAAIVESEGALRIHAQFYLGKGRPIHGVHLALQQSPFGRMMISTVEDTAADLYTIGTHNYLVEDGKVSQVYQEGTQEDFDWYWESYCFPYGSLEMLNSVRQDENGYSYYLITSDENMSFEYVVDAQMQIVQLRVYTRNENGTLVLDSTVDYEKGGAKAVPAKVLMEMRKDFVE